MIADKRTDQSYLLNILTDRFNNEERKDLCFQLRVNYETLMVNGLVSPREIVLHCARRGMLGELVEVIRKNRPDILGLDDRLMDFQDLRVFVNRAKESEAFLQIISESSRERILLLEAEGGMGKSFLMGEYDSICPQEFIFIPLDLKVSTLGLTALWSTVCDFVGWSFFPCFQEQVSLYSKDDSLNIVREFETRHRLEKLLSISNEDVRARRLTGLSNAFLSDLAVPPRPIVLAIDAFEKATLEIKNWVTSLLLPRVRILTALRIVIAGRQVPRRSFEWEKMALHIRLSRISINDWMEFARIIRCEVAPETVSAFYSVFDGRPLDMATSLATLVRKGAH